MSQYINFHSDIGRIVSSSYVTSRAHGGSQLRNLLESWKPQRPGPSRLWEENLPHRPLSLDPGQWLSRRGQACSPPSPLGTCDTGVCVHLKMCVILATTAPGLDLAESLLAVKLGETEVFALISVDTGTNNRQKCRQETGNYHSSWGNSLS